MPNSTNVTNLDRYWMQRALELARWGIGLCSPNPVVGCVILDSAGQIVGDRLGFSPKEFVDSLVG